MTPEPPKSGVYGIVAREDSVPSTTSTTRCPQKSKSRFARFWQTGHRQARQDIRARGRTGAFWVLSYIFFAGLIYALSALSTLSSPGSIITNRLTTACAPDGALYTNPSEFSFWRATGFFQVTLGSGHMTFAQAKVVDVVWDVVFGRGGQALLTFVSWKVFTQYVTTSMQVAPVTFSTFRTIFVHGDATALGVWRLVADFSRRRGLQSRLAMVFMVATMVFVLAFPVIAAAMTGYSANVEPFVQVAKGRDYVPFESLRGLYFVVHDGERIGLQKDYKVVDPKDRDAYPALYTSMWSLQQCPGDPSCQLINNVTSYVENYGSGRQQNVASTFANFTLPSPTLNITAFSLPPYFIRRHQWQRTILNPGNVFNDPHRMAWVQNNLIYNTTDVQNLGQCQPTKTYNWGFSFIQVILMILLLLTWSIGTYTMYLHSYATLHKRGRTQADIIGEYQAIFELSNAMHNDLVQHASAEETKDVSHLTETQLRRRIAKDLNGGSISFQSQQLLRSERGAWQFGKALKKEAWWIGFLVLATPAAIWCGFVPYLAPSVIPLPLPVVFAMYVRTTGKSGAVLVFWPVVVLVVVQMLLLAMLLTGGLRG